MAQALQSAQSSLAQAGMAQGQQPGQKGQNGEATEEEMGKEFQGQRGQGQKGQGGPKGNRSQSQQIGAGMGNAGRGAGGSAGPQEPLPGSKKDKLIAGMVNPKGEKLTRSYMGTPDPTKDEAAYYSVVPEKVKAAEASLNREDIPVRYKEPVRQYFEAIQPR